MMNTKNKFKHGGTEFTEKNGVFSLILRDLRASVLKKAILNTDK